jgi:hypothetical protein
MRFALGVLSSIEPGRPVIDLPDGRAFATGNGPHDYVCGRCGNILFGRIDLPAPPKVIVVCGKCRTPNGMTFTAPT